MTRLTLAAFALAFGVGWLATVHADDGGASARDPASPSALVSEIHQAGGYPSSLTLREPAEPTPQWLRDLADAIEALLRAVAPLLKVVLYVLLAGFVLYLVHRLYNHYAQPEEGEPEPVAPPVESLRTTVEDWLPPGDPEALAAQGQFKMAILILLLQALKRVGWGTKPRDRARTAREVLEAVPETDRRRPPLGALIERVEPIRFGNAETSATTYDEVRRLFLQLCEVA